MMEPPQDAIDMVVMITNADRQTAIKYLKAKNNNADSAVNAIFDGEDITGAEAATTWDEAAFSTDREGGNSEAYGPHNFSYQDGNLRPLTHSAAPTRGSSPVPSLKQPSTRAEEDAEMERALANSRQDLRYPAQEFGTVGSDGKTTSTHFGPATRQRYDPTQWAMTAASPATGHEAGEVVPDLEPGDRQHQPDQPRFLKPLPSGSYLPNLLTIAHSIPLAREALLTRAISRTMYGHDPDWWKGHAIKLPRIVHSADGAPAEPANNQHDEIVAEMQRIMALLDASHRSYGSAEALARTALASHGAALHPSENTLDKIIQTWETAAIHTDPEHEAEKNIFHSIIATTSPEGLHTPDMWVLPLNVTIDEAASDGTVTLAEVMDTTLWDTDPDDDTLADNYMERPADVLPMRVTQTDSSKETLRLIIPPSFYVDKYLKENVDTSRVVRRAMVQTKKRVKKIDELEQKLKHFKHPLRNEQIDVGELVKHTLNHYNGEHRKAVLAEREERAFDIDTSAAPLPPSYAAIAAKLEAVCHSISEKIEVLEEEKEKARKTLASLSQDDPPGLAADSLKHRYTLRGVATKPHVTYLLRPASGTREDEAMSTGDAPEGMQWWRIEYDAGTTSNINSVPRILLTESSEDDVLRAVELEHNEALLVYASERAATSPLDPTLAASLLGFIRQDNNHFSAELLQADALHAAGRAYAPSVVEPLPDRPPPRILASSDSSSTAAHFDDEALGGLPDVEPPPYADAHHGYYDADAREKTGLLGAGQGHGESSPPAHEIRLDDAELEPDEGVEMIERAAREPVFATGAGVHATARARSGSDDSMADVIVGHESGG